MAEKIKIYPKTLADGGLEFEISIEDQSLLGKKATVSVKREVTVKGSRPVHETVKIFVKSHLLLQSQPLKNSAYLRSGNEKGCRFISLLRFKNQNTNFCRGQSHHGTFFFKSTTKI